MTESNKNISYGSFEGYAVRFTDHEAWELTDAGTWRRFGAPGEILGNAALLTEDAFHSVFGDVPPLPAEAFRKNT